MKLIKSFLLCVVLIQLNGCMSPSVKLSENPKPGFSNVTDVAVPESAKIELDKTMIMGGHDHWTGHLVYTTKEPVANVIDFVNSQMQNLGWNKISVLRGPETNFTFTRMDRVANVKITTISGFLSKITLVSIDMATTSSKAGSVQSCVNCNKS